MKRETSKLLTILTLLFVLITFNVGMKYLNDEDTNKGRPSRISSQVKGSRIQLSSILQEAIK